MKKLLVVLVLSLSFIACSSDDDSPIDGHLNASYEFKIGDEVISSNNSIPIEILTDTNGLANQISVTEPDDQFVMMFSIIPINVGDVKQLDGDTQIAVTGHIVANYLQIFVDEGTITRDADGKVSFTGTFEHEGTTHNVTGFIKSDGIKNN